jgi:ribonuclease HI
MKSLQYIGGFDGSATPNPGKMRIGGWIGNPLRQVIHTFSKVIGHGTGNEAEYYAFIELIRQAKKLGINNISVRGDSATVVNQMNMRYRVKSPRMQTLFNLAKEEVRDINLTLALVPREYNKKADELTHIIKPRRQECRKLNY